VAVAAQDDREAPRIPNLRAAKAATVEFKAELTDGWRTAAKLETPTHFKPGFPGPDVELRAMHDGDSVYIMARWRDDARSETKSAWEYKEGGWLKAKGDEDRIAFAFDMNADGFYLNGCTALCHDNAMGTKAEDQHADLWHWKAARGGQNGQCDDQHFAGGKNGRPDDSGKSAYETNADGESPKWVWKEGVEKSIFNADSSRELREDFKPAEGYTVPSVRLREPEGSRSDVKSAAQWSDGWWTVVLKRKLDSGNKDDVKFVTGESVSFAFAVMNNTGVKSGTEHAKSPLLTLTLE
jgi:hypothetical protein